MEISWSITQDDVNRVKQFVKDNESRSYVKKRVRDNVELPLPFISRDTIWEVQFDCLLTTQQKSGPKSSVARLMHEKPFPFSYSTCTERKDVAAFVTKTLRSYRGIRFCDRIGQYVGSNYAWFNNGGWKKFEDLINPLVEQRRRMPKPEDQKAERKASEGLRTHLLGIGPKQARNYLQLLGLTRYELPIDSRFLSWFKELGIPIGIEQRALSYPPTYNAVQDKIQELCMKAGVLPCVLDACVFARNDDEWPENFNS